MTQPQAINEPFTNRQPPRQSLGTDFGIAMRAKFIQDLANQDDTFNAATAHTIFTATPQLAGTFGWSEDNNQVVFFKKLNLSQDVVIEKGAINDTTATLFQTFFQRNGFSKANWNVVFNGLVAAAHAKPFREFELFLDEVDHKGSNRPDIFHDLVVNKLKAEDNEYNVFWLRSLMAAIYKQQTTPRGAKYERVPFRYFVFGAQGIGKTYFLESLANGNTMDFGEQINKDTMVSLGGAVIANADDKASQQTKIVDDIKSLVTQSTFNIRLPYARTNTIIRNMAVFVGSTNRWDAYTDTTGLRREMPINVGHDMNTAEATQWGFKWVNDQKKNDPNYFFDLWKTFIDEYKQNPIAPEPWENETVMKQRDEELTGHQRLSDLSFEIEEMLNAEVPAAFTTMDKNSAIDSLLNAVNDSVSEVDPFGDTNKIKFSDLKEVKSTIVVKHLKTVHESKVSRASIIRAMRDVGYKERTTDHVLVKRGE